MLQSKFTYPSTSGQLNTGKVLYSCLNHKYYTTPKILAREKHSSLFSPSESVTKKKVLKRWNLIPGQGSLDGLAVRVEDGVGAQVPGMAVAEIKK